MSRSHCEPRPGLEAMDVKRERKYLARGAVERPLGVGLGVEQAGGQWARGFS